MALTSSGQIKMSEIGVELGRSADAANTTLKQLSDGSYATINTSNASSNRPDGDAPHSMSEFYSYNHSAGSLTSNTFYYSALSQVCSNNGSGTTVYHDGSGTHPAVGDTLYEDSSGSTTMSAGFYLSVGSATGVIVNSEGTVSETYGCGRSERRLKYNIEYMGDSLMGIPMYHFNYKDESYGKGRFVGTMVDDLERLGFEKALIRTEDGIFVNYDKIDVPFHNITNW